MKLNPVIVFTTVSIFFSCVAYAKTVIVNAPGDGFLALRSEPSTSTGVRLLKIPHGTALNLGSCAPNPGGDNWCMTTYRGQTGWILDRYLKPLKASARAEQASSGTPVLIGGDVDGDACSIGAVSGLTPGGDGFLAVRSGPGSSYKLVGKLLENQVIAICNSSPDGKWIGVVYSRPVFSLSDTPDCGVGRNLDQVQPYLGHCKSGWVSSRWIIGVAD